MGRGTDPVSFVSQGTKASIKDRALNKHKTQEPLAVYWASFLGCNPFSLPHFLVPPQGMLPELPHRQAEFSKLWPKFVHFQGHWAP